MAAAVALLATVYTGGELASAGDRVPWLGVAIGQATDALLSLAALPILIRVARRHPLADERWRQALAIHLAAASCLALACMILFVAVQEVVAATALEDVRATSVDLGGEFARMTLLSSLAQLLLRAPAEDAPAATAAARSDLLDIRDGARRHLLPLDEVRWADAQGNYVRLHTIAGRRLMRATMREVEARLGDRFVRIHRSAIVRRDAVREIATLDSGRAVVRLDDDTIVPVGRVYRDRVRSLLAQGRSSPA